MLLRPQNLDAWTHTKLCHADQCIEEKTYGTSYCRDHLCPECMSNPKPVDESYCQVCLFKPKDIPDFGEFDRHPTTSLPQLLFPLTRAPSTYADPSNADLGNYTPCSSEASSSPAVGVVHVMAGMSAVGEGSVLEYEALKKRGRDYYANVAAEKQQSSKKKTLSPVENYPIQFRDALPVALRTTLAEMASLLETDPQQAYAEPALVFPKLTPAQLHQQQLKIQQTKQHARLSGGTNRTMADHESAVGLLGYDVCVVDQSSASLVLDGVADLQHTTAGPDGDGKLVLIGTPPRSHRDNQGAASTLDVPGVPLYVRKRSPRLIPPQLPPSTQKQATSRPASSGRRHNEEDELTPEGPPRPPPGCCHHIDTLSISFFPGRYGPTWEGAIIDKESRQNVLTAKAGLKPAKAEVIGWVGCLTCGVRVRNIKTENCPCDSLVGLWNQFGAPPEGNCWFQGAAQCTVCGRVAEYSHIFDI
eukprot:TRINITY_DN63231_c0_g1_i1.p1 TRINITY_DN63231_c0_g1~~TRINITY_DN63231_c0_g1_i1.p1  ORF type:complete len:473 (+),score=41.00 TRINITY_DN63231_c0_g1_i1:31-1449(+)